MRPKFTLKVDIYILLGKRDLVRIYTLGSYIFELGQYFLDQAVIVKGSGLPRKLHMYLDTTVILVGFPDPTGINIRITCSGSAPLISLP